MQGRGGKQQGEPGPTKSLWEVLTNHNSSVLELLSDLHFLTVGVTYIVHTGGNLKLLAGMQT